MTVCSIRGVGNMFKEFIKQSKCNPKAYLVMLLMIPPKLIFIISALKILLLLSMPQNILTLVLFVLTVGAVFTLPLIKICRNAAAGSSDSKKQAALRFIGLYLPLACLSGLAYVAFAIIINCCIY